MSYRKVVQAYWEGDLARFLRGDPEGHAVAFYLMTCPAANAVGCYRLSRATISDDVGFDVTEALGRLSGSTPGVLGKYLDTPFVVLDDEYRMVFVVEFGRHEWGTTPNPANNRVKNLLKMLPEMATVGRKSFVWKAFRERYESDWEALFEVLGDDFASTSQVLEDASSRARQEQDQDQSQDQGGKDTAQAPVSGSPDLDSSNPPDFPIGAEQRPFLGLTKPEERKLSKIIEDGTADPSKNRALKQTDAKALRLERLHLLAWLVTLPTPPESDTVLDLWAAWRRKSRNKAKPRRKQDDCTDFESEVMALRLLMEQPAEALAAIGDHALPAGWRGFQWKWIEPGDGNGRGGGNGRREAPPLPATPIPFGEPGHDVDRWRRSGKRG